MDNPVVLVVLAMVFAAIVLSLQALWFYIRGRRDEEAERIQHRLGVDRFTEEEELASLLREQATDSARDALGNAGVEIQQTLKQAGSDMTVSQLIGQMLLVFFVALLGLGILVGPKSAVIAPMIAYLPLWWIKRKAASRAKAMLGQLPDALEMMGRAMQTGAGLVDCFRLAQEEMPEPLASEFGRISDEVRFGKDWRLALDELIQRNPTLFDLRLFVSSILLQRETGGNMIETFNRISKLIRARSSFDGKVKAMTSEARASGFILAMMPIGVALLVFIATAPYLEPLWTTALGQMVDVYAVVSYGMGIMLMQSSSRVEI